MNKIKKLPKINFNFNRIAHDTYFEVDGVRTYKLGLIDKINELVDAINLLNKKNE